MLNQVIKKISFLTLLLFACSLIHAQEICDNGIDDDADGLIDLNDEDCNCISLIESSLIPNPSFEEMTCCPNANEMLHCAVNWIQASAATSDYVHACEGYLGNNSIPAVAPLPFPDGEGAVGFRDGQQFAGWDYKEYVGACLTEAMEVGVTYRLDFFVGFQNNISGSMEFDMAFFGSTNCNNLPFGGNNFNIGCPVNAGNYTQLTQQTVSGNNAWVNVVVEFVADQPYEVIVLGPSCELNPFWMQDPYFYVDRLAFEEVGAFGIPFDNVSGTICQNNLVLSINEELGNTYQWYLDGVAIIGETDPSITLTTDDSEGTYLVVITTPDGCSSSKEYDLLIPPYYAPIDVGICENEFFIVGTDSINQSGYYELTIPAMDGCDSIVQLTLDVEPNTYSFLKDTFCEGNTYVLHDLSTEEPGLYEINIPNLAGCDSIIELELSTIPLGTGVIFNDPIEVMLGEFIDLAPAFYDPRLIYFNWYDVSNILFAETLVVEDFQPVDNTTLFLESSDQYGCDVIDTVEIRVDKSNIQVYIPNAFSPDGNGINDFFKYYETIALQEVEAFAVFNRWGAEVYREENIVEHLTFRGWDGQFKGKDAAVGVYAYYIKAVFLDGNEKIFEGDVTLFR